MNGWREGGGTHKELSAPESLVYIPERGLLMNGGQLKVSGGKLMQNVVLEIHLKVPYSFHFNISNLLSIPDSSGAASHHILSKKKEVAYLLLILLHIL